MPSGRAATVRRAMAEFSPDDITGPFTLQKEGGITANFYFAVALPDDLVVTRFVLAQGRDDRVQVLCGDRLRLIGAHIAGHSAGEMINELTLAMNNELTVDAIIGSIHAYPTYSFGISVALYDYVLNEHPQAVAKFGRFLSKFT